MFQRRWLVTTMNSCPFMAPLTRRLATPGVRGRVEPPLRAWANRGCMATGNRVSGVSVVVCDTTNQRAVTLTPHDTLIHRP